MKDSRKRNILVIDDDEAMRETIAFFLEEEGHSVTVCNDGIEGVGLFAQHAYDLVITDIMMPGKDGLGAMIDMEQIDSGVPVLAISGVSMKDALLDAADLFGAVHTLRKPFTKKDLLWAVADIFDTASLRA